MVMLRQRLLPQEVRPPRARAPHVVHLAGPDALQGEGNGGATAVGPGVVEAWDAGVETQTRVGGKKCGFLGSSSYKVERSVGNCL